MLQLFEEHTLKHYSYLRDTMPNLVPALRVSYAMQHNKMCVTLIYTLKEDDLYYIFQLPKRKILTFSLFI
jgi:hypothetical protein